MNNNKGFTILELTVVTGIIVILASLSLSLYAGVSQNRNLQIGSDEVTSILNQAKSYSLSQIKTTSCSGELESYTVSISTGSKCYSISENCTSSSTPLRTECLSSSLSFGKNATVVFPIMNGTVAFSCSPAPCSSIVINGSLGSQKTISVDAKGIIVSQ